VNVNRNGVCIVSDLGIRVPEELKFDETSCCSTQIILEISSGIKNDIPLKSVFNSVIMCILLKLMVE